MSAPVVLNVKQGTVGPETGVVITLFGSDNLPFDLTDNTSVKFSMARYPGETKKVDSQEMVVVGLTTGQVRYDWQADDLDTPVDYVGEVEVDYDEGKVQRFPDDGWLVIKVRQSVS